MKRTTTKPFTLPPLPYALDALEPYISARTLFFHYGKHHRGYVDALNRLLAQRADLHGKTLVELICTTRGPIFNNAAQVWNHTFYWHAMSPMGGGIPRGAVGAQIRRQWPSFDAFRAAFTDAARNLFGSGWVWLALAPDGTLHILPLKDADNPMVYGMRPVLVCDVWEHAYYLDVQNDRVAYVDNWWNLVNWDFANTNMVPRR
jgi:Fe-Mn family superoxide dismutase